MFRRINPADQLDNMFCWKPFLNNNFIRWLCNKVDLNYIFIIFPRKCSDRLCFSDLSCALYYYSKDNSTLEEDFFIRSANELIPVEVKANTNRAKSMRQLIKSDTYTDIKHGIKLMAGNVGISENIVTFPYFCTFLLKRYMGKQNLFQ